MNYLRDIIAEGIERLHTDSDKAWNERARVAPGPRLHPSSVEGCTRAAILTAVHPFPDHPLRIEHTNPFDSYTKSLMLSGRVWEKQLTAMLLHSLCPTSDIQNFSNSIASHTPLWSWELDGLIPVGTPGFPGGLIIELKDTASYNFRIKSRLPYKHHAVQLMVYQILENKLQRIHNFPARLYYNGRGQWAEFDVRYSNGYIYCEGQRNGYPHETSFEYDVPARMGYLEAWLESGELPPREATPFERSFGCVKGTDKKGFHPSCRWAQHCWPDMPDGPFPRSALEADEAPW